jgi:hypothetical protein
MSSAVRCKSNRDHRRKREVHRHLLLSGGCFGATKLARQLGARIELVNQDLVSARAKVNDQPL